MVDDSLGMRAALSTIKNTIVDVIDQLDIAYDKTRVALGTFANIAVTRWELNRYTDKVSLQNAVRHFEALNFALAAHNMVGVNHAVNYFNTGDRANIPDVEVFISGSGPHRQGRFLFQPREQVIGELHQRSKNVIAVAVGNADQAQMRRIATDSLHYFFIPSFLSFDQQTFVRNVVNLICQ